MCRHEGSLTTILAVYSQSQDKWICTAAICVWCRDRRVLWPDAMKTARAPVSQVWHSDNSCGGPFNGPHLHAHR